MGRGGMFADPATATQMPPDIFRFNWAKEKEENRYEKQ